MTKHNIQQLAKARKNCLENVELLLNGTDISFPDMEDIDRAERLLNIAERIDSMISEYEFSL